MGRFFGAVACAVLLSACATTKSDLAAKPAVPTMDELLSKAGEASSAGRKEEAVTLWKQAAAAYPADKAPWASIAQARYDAGQYGEAISSAQEVLVRDPNDTKANSIIAVSGLRLSTRALADLSRQNNLSGSVRTESQELAKLLRESLGENKLFESAATAQQPGKQPHVVGKGPSRIVKQKVKPVAESGSCADPFCSLKK
jgi:tetratricopeptide (TPR) repeat protein